MPSTSAPGETPGHRHHGPPEPHPFDFHDAVENQDSRPEYFAGMEEMLLYFEGVTVAVVNYSPEDANAIRVELQMLGARVRDRYTNQCTHVMTPYQQGPDYTEAARDGKIVVSYAWLEDCLTARRVVPHSDKVLYQPIRDEHGVPGMDKVVVSIAGYKGPIRNDIRELIEATGATFNQNFTKKTTHLVCYRAESEVYAKALLFKLEGQALEIVNHRWIEDSAKSWRRMPEEQEAYRKLGVEVDFEERLDAEKKLRMDVESQLEEEERSRRNLQELLESEEQARQEMQQQLMEEEQNRVQLRTQLDGEGHNREALQHQFSRSRSDIDSLQSLLQQSEASRGKQEQQLLAAEEERRGMMRQVEDMRRQQTALQSQFSSSRQDLLTQLEARLNSIEQLRSELDNEAKSHGDTVSKLDHEVAQHKLSNDKIAASEKLVKQLQDQLASEGRDKGSLQKQLEAERKSRLHILSDFESERKQREHLIKQLEAEQKLRVSLQKAVSTKEDLRLKAEEEVERLNRDIQEMMDEIDRLKTFKPPEKTDEEKINVKLFLEDDIRFLEVDPDASYEELIIAVGKVFIETYVIKFEDQDNHHITLKTSDDLKIAIRQSEKAESPYLRLVLEKAGSKKKSVFGFSKKAKAGDAAAGAAPGLDRKASWFKSSRKSGLGDDESDFE
jgi:chromosome segregation ATPase